jgi:hypothetical protein
MEPLFPMLSAHLCCGLAHIDTYIQRDSLKHLDEILSSLPSKIFSFGTSTLVQMYNTALKHNSLLVLKHSHYNHLKL